MNPAVRFAFFNPVMNYAVWSLRRYIRRVATMVPAGKSIVDIGAGECQYKPFFAKAAYISTDWCGTTDHHQYSVAIDHICPADNLLRNSASSAYLGCEPTSSGVCSAGISNDIVTVCRKYIRSSS